MMSITLRIKCYRVCHSVGHSRPALVVLTFVFFYTSSLFCNKGCANLNPDFAIEISIFLFH